MTTEQREGEGLGFFFKSETVANEEAKGAMPKCAPDIVRGYGYEQDDPLAHSSLLKHFQVDSKLTQPPRKRFTDPRRTGGVESLFPDRRTLYALPPKVVPISEPKPDGLDDKIKRVTLAAAGLKFAKKKLLAMRQSERVHPPWPWELARPPKLATTSKNEPRSSDAYYLDKDPLEKYRKQFLHGVGPHAAPPIPVPTIAAPIPGKQTSSSSLGQYMMTRDSFRQIKPTTISYIPMIKEILPESFHKIQKYTLRPKSPPSDTSIDNAILSFLETHALPSSRPSSTLTRSPAFTFNQHADGFVKDIMHLLNSDRMGIVRATFAASQDTLTRDEFLRLIFSNIQTVNIDDVSLIKNLIELFHQVDINGDGSIDWEEFTAYVIEALKKEDYSLQIADDLSEETSHLIPEFTLSHKTRGPLFNTPQSQIPTDPLETLSRPFTKQKLMSRVSRISYLPHFNKLALITEQRDTIKLLNPNSPHFQCHGTLENGHLGEIVAFTEIPQLNYYVTAGTDTTLCFWDAKTNSIHQRLPTKETQSSLCWEPESFKRLYTGSFTGMVSFWNPETLICLGRFKAHPQAITAMTSMPNSNAIVTGAIDGSIKVWDQTDLTLKATLSRHEKGIVSLCYHSELKLLCSAGLDHSIYIWNPYVMEPLASLKEHTTALVGIQLIPNTPLLCSGDVDGFIHIWNLRTYMQHQTFEIPMDTHAEEVGTYFAIYQTHAFPPKPQMVAGIESLYVYSPIQKVNAIDADSASLIWAAYNPAYHTFCSISGNKFRQWDAMTGQLIFECNHPTSSAEVAAATMDMHGEGARTRKLVLTSLCGSVHILNYQTGTILHQWTLPETVEVISVHYNHFDNHIVILAANSMVYVYEEEVELASHEIRRPLQVLPLSMPLQLPWVGASMDMDRTRGKLFAVSCYDSFEIFEFHNFASCALIKVDDSDGISTLAFLPGDGATNIITFHTSMECRIWDMSGFRPKPILQISLLAQSVHPPLRSARRPTVRGIVSTKEERYISHCDTYNDDFIACDTYGTIYRISLQMTWQPVKNRSLLSYIGVQGMAVRENAPHILKTVSLKAEMCFSIAQTIPIEICSLVTSMEPVPMVVITTATHSVDIRSLLSPYKQLGTLHQGIKRENNPKYPWDIATNDIQNQRQIAQAMKQLEAWKQNFPKRLEEQRWSETMGTLKAAKIFKRRVIRVATTAPPPHTSRLQPHSPQCTQINAQIHKALDHKSDPTLKDVIAKLHHQAECTCACHTHPIATPPETNPSHHRPSKVRLPLHAPKPPYVADEEDKIILTSSQYQSAQRLAQSDRHLARSLLQNMINEQSA